MVIRFAGLLLKSISGNDINSPLKFLFGFVFTPIGSILLLLLLFSIVEVAVVVAGGGAVFCARGLSAARFNDLNVLVFELLIDPSTKFNPA